MRLIKRIFYILLLIVLLGFLYFFVQVALNKPIEEVSYEKMVKPSPGWMSVLPLYDISIAHAIYPTVYLPLDQYDEFYSGDVSVWLDSVLVHEKFHLIRMEESNPLTFGVRYMTSKKFRLEEELLAIKEQMEYLKEHGEEYPVEWKAEQFAGETYGEVLDFEQSVYVLSTLWESGEIVLE